MSRWVVASFLLCLPACSTPHRGRDDGLFDPIRFFLADSVGEGTLRKLLGHTVPVQVTSSGSGDLQQLRLVQTIREGSNPARTRVWTIRRIDDRHFTGTLTDAAGPVHIEVRGSIAFVHYRMKNGLIVDQQLALEPNSLVICNELKVSKLGIPVARLNETIRRLPLGEDLPANCTK